MATMGRTLKQVKLPSKSQSFCINEIKHMVTRDAMMSRMLTTHSDFWKRKLLNLNIVTNDNNATRQLRQKVIAFTPLKAMPPKITLPLASLSDGMNAQTPIKMAAISRNKDCFRCITIIFDVELLIFVLICFLILCKINVNYENNKIKTIVFNRNHDFL